MSDQSAPQEIVIVRRRGGGEEEGHHGGAWKIAYADFMTAMMAFFLVMWLVNAADKKVLTQVASYFNPLRMSERVSAKKGVEELVEGQSSASKAGKQLSKASDEKDVQDVKAAESDKAAPKEEAAEPSDKKASAEGGQTDMTEQELFNDPYGILEKLASQAIVGRQGGSEANTGTGRSETGGEAFRDPFDPEFSRAQAEAAKTPSTKPAPPANADKEAPPASAKNTADAAPGAAGKQAPGEDKAKAEAAATTPAPDKANGKKDAVAEKEQKAADLLQNKLAKALVDFAPGQKPTLTVKATPDGVLISLTDEFDFAMFKLSSAEPNKQLVAAVKRIGGVLKGMPGLIVVRGHTDGRPFAKGTSDNWKLSSQRALMARYMLINGGIDQSRFSRIEGYADTSLLVATDPLAAQNRRIEILLRNDGKK
ncbi:MAG: MotB family protein [Hyphomicrobium sp.]